MSKKLVAHSPASKARVLGSPCESLKINTEKLSSGYATLRSVQPTTSSHMEQIVSQLAAKYAVDLAQCGSFFRINPTHQPHRWLITHLDRDRIGVTRRHSAQDNRTAPELDIVFEVHPTGWEPVEIVHTPAVWQAYVNAAQACAVVDAQGDFNFAGFADYYAQQLEAAAQRADEPKVAERKAGATFIQQQISFHTHSNAQEFLE